MTDTLEKEKEAVARIIDPNVWALIDHWRNKLANRPDLDVRIEEKAKPSLSKAGWIIDKIEASRSPSPQPKAPSEERASDAWAWFNDQRRLELSFYSPVYGDDDDQSREWRVHRQGGSINDREWDLIGKGNTALDAVLAARFATDTQPVAGGGDAFADAGKPIDPD